MFTFLEDEDARQLTLKNHFDEQDELIPPFVMGEGGDAGESGTRGSAGVSVI